MTAAQSRKCAAPSWGKGPVSLATTHNRRSSRPEYATEYEHEHEHEHDGRMRNPG